MCQSLAPAQDAVQGRGTTDVGPFLCKLRDDLLWRLVRESGTVRLLQEQRLLRGAEPMCNLPLAALPEVLKALPAPVLDGPAAQADEQADRTFGDLRLPGLVDEVEDLRALQGGGQLSSSASNRFWCFFLSVRSTAASARAFSFRASSF